MPDQHSTHWSAVDPQIAQDREVTLVLDVFGVQFTETFVVDCIDDGWLVAHPLGDEHTVIFGEHPDALLPTERLTLSL